MDFDLSAVGDAMQSLATTALTSFASAGPQLLAASLLQQKKRGTGPAPAPQQQPPVQAPPAPPPAPAPAQTQTAIPKTASVPIWAWIAGGVAVAIVVGGTVYLAMR